MMIGALAIMTPWTIQSAKAAISTMYMRLEIAAVSPSRQSFQTCGTKQAVVQVPATMPSTVQRWLCIKAPRSNRLNDAGRPGFRCGRGRYGLVPAIYACKRRRRGARAPTSP